MRVLVSVLFSAVAIFAQDSPPVSPAAPVPDNLTIPVQLSKTIDTNKCKAGDTVELKTMEPVLIANGLVMPHSAKLHGKILGAASRLNDQPSWVLLVVDRADWKQHSLPLHAFVVAQITIKAQVTAQTNNAFDNAMNPPARSSRRRAGPISVAPGRDTRGQNHTLQDATIDPGDTQQLSFQKLEDLRIMQDKNGRVFLVSQKSHLKLPSGTMLMLRNQPRHEPQQVDATSVAAVTH